MNTGSFLELFMLNAAALTTFFYIFLKIFHSFLFPCWKRREYVLIFGSILAGFLSMYVGIKEETGVLFDLRYVPIVLAPFLVQRTSSILFIAVGIGLCRLFFGLTPSSYVGAVYPVLIGLATFLLSYFPPIKNQHFSAFVTSLIFITVGNMINITVFAAIGPIDRMHYLQNFAPISFIAGMLGGIITTFLIRDMDFDAKMRNQLKEEIAIDSLTGVFNYRYIDHYFNSLVKTDCHQLSVAFIDIDYFKRINDTYGHLGGDVALKTLAKELKIQVGSKGIVSRYAGDEFLLLFPDEKLEEVYLITERIRRNIEKIVCTSPTHETFSLTFSAGVASYPDFSLEEIIRKADEALYQAKALGRNRVVVASPFLDFSSPMSF